MNSEPTSGSAASEIQSNEPVACQDGSNFMVKNLFFNVPARRKFLKTNSTELRHIINEFNHVALAHPDIEFSLIHNNSQIFNLPGWKSQAEDCQYLR